MRHFHLRMLNDPLHSRLPLPTPSRYVILSVVQTLYAYLVERDIVFLGKRKTFDKRVSHLASAVILGRPRLTGPFVDRDRKDNDYLTDSAPFSQTIRSQTVPMPLVQLYHIVPPLSFGRQVLTRQGENL